MLVSFKKIDQL